MAQIADLLQDLTRLDGRSKLHELKERRSQRVASMQQLVAKAESEKRDLSGTESQAFDSMKDEIRGLDTQIQRAETLAELERRADAEPVGDTGLEQLERRVSLVGAIRAQMEGRPLQGAEAEYAREIERRTGRPPQGFYAPLSALEIRVRNTGADMERRVNTTTTLPELIPVDHRPDLYIEPFRRRLLARRLGARVLTGLRGDLSIPKTGTGLTAAWVAENTAIPESNLALDSVGLSPRHVGGLTELSRQLIQQSSPDVEQLVRDDLAAVIAEAIDSAVLAGSGANEPIGVMNTAGTLVGTLVGPTWAQVLAMIAALEDRELPGPLTWVMSGKAARVLRGTLKTAGGETYLMEGGMLGELPAVASGKIPDGAGVATAMLGDFSQVLVGVWSELDILVNPYAETPYRKGNVLVRGMATVDAALRAPDAFIVAEDIPAA